MSAFINPNVVKVVLDVHGHALYFSRAPIPYPRDAFMADLPLSNDMSIYRHIGIYGYRVGFLKNYANLQTSVIERIESLEQLRVLYHGYKISMFITENAPASGVDTQTDLDFVRSLISETN
jgi:3-deoxy-manno-octulosonate cytidylyltransferase (CMP-KDO synthetase)